MTTYVIHIEGQQIPVDAAIGASDDLVRKALAPVYPQAANAAITRVEKDDTVTIQVVKRAGTKGGDPAEYLEACAGGMNPAVALMQELRKTDEALQLGRLLALDQQIERAIREGREQAAKLEAAAKRLDAARPAAAPEVPWGF